MRTADMTEAQCHRCANRPQASWGARALNERPTTVTAAPFAAHESARARPMPLVPPMTCTRLPLRSSLSAASGVTVTSGRAVPYMVARAMGEEAAKDEAGPVCRRHARCVLASYGPPVAAPGCRYTYAQRARFARPFSSASGPCKRVHGIPPSLRAMQC